MLLKILTKFIIAIVGMTFLLLLNLSFITINKTYNKLDQIRYFQNTHSKDYIMNTYEINRIFNSKKILYKGEMHYYDKGEVKYISYNNMKFHKVYELFYINDTGSGLYTKLNNRYIYVDFIKDVNCGISLFIFLIPLTLVLFSYLTLSIMRDEVFYSTLHKKSIATDMEISTAIRFAENTAHEVRTPLDVIGSKLYKIEETFNDIIFKNENVLNSTICATCMKRLKVLNQDFKLIDVSLAQITDQIDKMSNYKNILHSNGNKTIFDLIDFARQSIVMKHDNIKIEIDPLFVNYGVLGMANSELLGIFVNHFKNSVEANAPTIDVVLKKYDVKKKLITLILTDTGNGVPESLKDHIFEANKSSKVGSLEVHGHGMFNNLITVVKSGGTLTLNKGYIKGTEFTMVLSVKESAIT